MEELVSILLAAGIQRLVDVRTAPASRKHPQFGKDALAEELRLAGIGYVWRKDLGGWRKARPDSPHTALRSASFRGYADHIDGDEFGAASAWLIETSRKEPTAAMCAETLWWRCHRRLLADVLTARGCRVLHLMPGGRVEPHRIHPAARILEARVVYDLEQPEQLALSDAQPS